MSVAAARAPAAAFDRAMDAAGPFEADPDLAVAVSGGADSMALAVIARDWAERHGGSVTALIVDHGLRPSSRTEALLAARRLRALGIRPRILEWTGPKPATGIQAAARAARYDLLTGWCRRNAVLHLLTAHHADDQAETFLIRRDRGSGDAGLAAMPLISGRDGVRLIRPLLAVRRRALRGELDRRGVAWIEDPSNDDERFERIRVRRRLAGREAVALRAMARAGRMGRKRAAREDTIADRLAAVRAMPEGWLMLPADFFRKGSAAIAAAALERCLLCVGGDAFPPRRERLDRLLAILRAPAPFRGRTLAGCTIAPFRGGLAICREAAATAHPCPIGPGERRLWDGRFPLRLPPGAAKGLGLASLDVVAGRPATLAAALRNSALPTPAKACLPALFDKKGPVAVPHLGWSRGPGAPILAVGGWQPRHPLAPARFFPGEESCFNGIADYLE